ncbi:hypothetical protein A2V49_02040 [candidate division WWE3 bacterium RBG_19FT_COMBO_34_6]|uniref:Phage holin family protein n=1 Tax=candidate division WWE3 bacterium RBG_19FT_COMBO_34_6 TaxID=1802612 RepID=A0A1F4UM37_UNCKA|nr:MAG: hypothetical protein A2V49_02040 [candidate division WWE3 bacterium RBG_19FT_COMBO_34_6]
MKIIIKLLLNSVAIFITAYILPGVSVNDFFTAFIVAIVLGILDIFVKPVLVILTLPITILTLGIFYVLINIFIIFLATSLVPGFTVNGVWSALLFIVVLTIVNSVLNGLAE